MTYDVRRNVPGADLTTLHVGGPCAKVITARTESDLLAALHDYDAIVIGGGSNLVIAGTGYDAPIIRAYRNDASTARVDLASGHVCVDASTDWDAFVACIVDAGLQGLESTSGVPGTVGGAVVQNAGAYGQEVGDVIASVKVWDTVDRTTRELSREKCGFAYRLSRFKHDPERRFVVTSVDFVLSAEPMAKARYGEVSELLEHRTGHPGPHTLAEIRDAVLAVRRRKGMVLGTSLPSAGSFFTNPRLDEDQAKRLEAMGFPVLRRSDGTRTISAATLIEAAGFHRGDRIGRAGLSEQHVLALVNAEDASTDDILALAKKVQQEVEAATGIALTPEPVLLGFGTPPL